MHNSDEVPNGTKPKKIFSRSNIIVYGTLLIISIYYLLPLWVMVMTSLKGMPEIRMGNIFSPPLEVTFEPWVKAWSYACTGINCDGLSRGFWNSVQILIPSLILSISVASVNGYALANWKFKGSEVFFTILIFGAFIPYQIMIYPIVILLREIGLMGSTAGLVLVHTIFGMPILTLLFRNHFAAIPEELFKAARVDGANPWLQFKSITFPNLLPTLTVLGLVGTLWASNVFDIIWMMTRGGPGEATTTVPVLMYDMAFYGYNISKATAGAIIFLFILIIFAFVFIFANRKQFVVASETFQDLSK